MTPAQAAQKADTSRWTIMRAIKGQHLLATRDNRNQWRITPEDLAAWRAAHLAHSAHTVQEPEVAQQTAHPAQDSAHPDKALEEEVETLRKERDGLRHDLERATDRAQAAEARATRAEADRDDWRDHAKELASRIPKPELAVPQPVGLWRRLLGRK